MRNIMYNLKDPKNPDFKWKVRVGTIKPADFPTLSSEDMASDAVKWARTKIRADWAAASESDWAERHGALPETSKLLNICCVHSLRLIAYFNVIMYYSFSFLLHLLITEITSQVRSLAVSVRRTERLIDSCKRDPQMSRWRHLLRAWIVTTDGSSVKESSTNTF